MDSKHKAFTIVELLIVVVVIAILATVASLAYNGIQNRANDTTVQADIRTINDKIRNYMVDSDGVPPAASQAGLQSIVRATKSAYVLRSGASFIYCRTDSQYGLVAQSKSGNAYVAKNGSFTKVVTVWGGSDTNNACSANTILAIQFPTSDPGYGYVDFLRNSTWASWVNN